VTTSALSASKIIGYPILREDQGAIPTTGGWPGRRRRTGASSSARGEQVEAGGEQQRVWPATANAWELEGSSPSVEEELPSSGHGVMRMGPGREGAVAAACAWWREAAMMGRGGMREAVVMFLRGSSEDGTGREEGGSGGGGRGVRMRPGGSRVCVAGNAHIHACIRPIIRTVGVQEVFAVRQDSVAVRQKLLPCTYAWQRSLPCISARQRFLATRQRGFSRERGFARQRLFAW
jgi:hypothetical protein